MTQDKKREEELIRKLAEWAEAIKHSRDETWYAELPLPDFTQSLDACFRWLVPKLYELPNIHILNYQYTCFAKDADLLRHSWGIHFKDRDTYYGNDRTSALALCRAIEKLIDEESK